MNRNFKERKPTKVYAKSKENQAIIKALNMYGRVPEQWELLEEIERLKKKIDEAVEYINEEKREYVYTAKCYLDNPENIITILQGSDDNE